MTACLALGLQRAAMDDSIRYCKERVQFGRPIGSYQLIQAKITNMAVNLEAGHLMSYKVTHLIDRNIPVRRSILKEPFVSSSPSCPLTSIISNLTYYPSRSDNSFLSRKS